MTQLELADELLEPLSDAWYAPEEVTGELRDAFVAWLRAWGERARAGGLDDAQRTRTMDALNPRFVLRNWLAQAAIEKFGGDSLGELKRNLEGYLARIAERRGNPTP